ncbi:MAG: rhamnulose-1-phosphate aldolase [Deltaproteobacteria bacterium]|nr:rhamnulose-1-phosphate aldolase [Deltaproteobacteria bacterium]
MPCGFSKLFKEIELVSRLLTDRGWAEKNAGNLSIDITQESRVFCKFNSDEIKLDTTYENLKNRIFLMTYSGSKFRDIAENARERLLTIRINERGDGYRISSRALDRRPTSELRTHLKIHNFLRGIKSDDNVVLHTHPTELIALSHIKRYRTSEDLNKLLVSAHPEVYINLRGKIGFVRYALTGSESLAANTLKALRDGKRLIVWERHGALSIDKDVITTFDNLDIANKAAQIALLLFKSGFQPICLSRRELKELDSLI